MTRRLVRPLVLASSALVLAPPRAPAAAWVRPAPPQAGTATTDEAATTDRWTWAWELGRRGTATAEQVEELLALGADADPELRWIALDTLERLADALSDDTHAEALLALLLERTRDPDVDVRWAAVGALAHYGLDRESRLEALATRAAADDPPVRRAAVAALGSTDPVLADRCRAHLLTWIESPDRALAEQAMRALARLGPLPGPAARALAGVVEHGSSARRRVAADALHAATFDDPAAVAALRRLGATSATREPALRALAGAPPQAPTPIESAERARATAQPPPASPVDRVDPGDRGDPTARAVAESVHDSTSSQPAAADGPSGPEPEGTPGERPSERALSSTEVRSRSAESAGTDRAPAESGVEASPARPAPPGTTPSGTASRGRGGLGSTPWIVLAGLVLAPYLWVLATYVARPAELWRAARWLDDWTVRRAGFAASRWSPSRWLGVEALAARPRSVDAWIAERAPRARHALASRPAARSRAVRVPTPAVIGGRFFEQPTTGDLRATLLGARSGLRLFGEGGSGKTTLAYRLAHAALADDPAELLLSARALPVVFETAESLPPDGSPAAWCARLRTELELALDERWTRRETERLARSGRLVVLLDGLSELDDATRRIATGLQAAWPRVVVLATARAPADFGPLFGTQVALVRIDGSDLARFLDRYLVARGDRHRLDDSAFFDGLGRLSRLADAGDVTPLIASLFVDAWLAGREDGEPLPRTLGELLDARLLRAVRCHGVRTLAVTAADATAAARCVLGTVLRPGSAPREVVRRALHDLDPERVDARIDELIALGVLETAGRASLRFTLDPLAEHLAAREAVGAVTDLAGWRRLLHAADRRPNAPQAVAGWFGALRDEARVRAERGDRAAAAALPELEQRLAAARTGTTRELVRSRVLPHRSPLADGPVLASLGPESPLPELLRALRSADPLVRARAADVVGARGPAGAAAVDALAGLVGTPCATGLGALARAAAASALARLGPSAAAALPELRRAAKDENELVRFEARRSIGALAAGASAPDQLVRPTADLDHARAAIGLDPPSGLGQVDRRADVARNEA